MADCEPLVPDNFRFPRRPTNRPALPRIGYRIGEYPDMLEAMVRQLDREVALAAWTHRDPDDPAIALVEGAAILGDILSFYQERYANEAFLRTAAWRESVADLVRLLGYRLAPAIGGRGTVAFEMKGARPVTVPAGFPLKADLEGADKPAEFETDAELVAWPHLSRFNLYRRRDYAGSLAAGKTSAEVAGDSAALDLKPGDRLMLLSAPPPWESGGSSFTTDQKRPQVLTVKEVRSVLGRLILGFEAGLSLSWTLPAVAYRLGRTFRHFGHAAAPIFTENVTDGGGTITGSKERDTEYGRHVQFDVVCGHTSADRNLDFRDIPLDQEVADLTVGRDVIVETEIDVDGEIRRLAVPRRIEDLSGVSMGFATQTGAVTMLRIDRSLIDHNDLSPDPTSDVRSYRVHEVTSPAIELRGEATGSGGAIASGTQALWFYGTGDEARAVAGRRLTLLHNGDGRVETLTCVNAAEDFAAGAAPQMWPLSFDAPPKRFVLDDFQEEAPTVSVFGNLVEVSEGKAVPFTALGNGDARAVFQTFRLPKPLTYHLSPGATPPQVPELTLYVGNRAWTRVSALFGQPPDAEVYVVREDADGVSWVQFGDGRTGARLPSGVGNVSAAFRTGSGARGPLKPDTTPTPGQRIAEIRKLQMPESAAGGTDREDQANAREAAPGKVQGLDRLVSLADYETELRAIPGVARVRAAWQIVDGVPAVALQVLLDSGREAEFEAVRDAIRGFARCRGPNRHALIVEQAFLRQAFVDLRFGLDGRFLEADVAAAVTAELAPMDAPGASPTGLFALRARQLGGREYATRIEAVAQAVEGVTFAQVTALGLFTASASRSGDPLVLPPAPRPLAQLVVPQPNELLALTLGALTLQAAPAQVETCA